MENKRKLAHIERIGWVKPIEGADNIELVGVLGWQCIAKKGEFQKGDPCVYIEIDSKVPETEAFEFLRAKNFKIKTMKLNKFKDQYGNGVISQGIAIPLGQFADTPSLVGLPEGSDATDILGITYSDPEDVKRKSNSVMGDKYRSMMDRRKEIFSKKWVKKMMKKAWFRKVMFALFGRKKDKPLQFPNWIAKTDEERIENLPQYLDDHTTVWLMTEKIDGTSTTFAIERTGRRKWEFIVCSRNVRMRTPDQPCYVGENVYWKMAYKYNVEDALKKIVELYESGNLMKVHRVVLQGETFGANLQGNPYRMKDIDFRAFNLIIEYKTGSEWNKHKLSTREMADVFGKCGLAIQTVPILGEYTFPEGIDMPAFKLEADGMSTVAEVKREGIVYRNLADARQSFKNVSNDFLLSKGGKKK